MTEQKKPSSGDLGQAEMQQKVDEQTEKGYLGVKVDPTPDDAYTVAGVTSHQPTPETDSGVAEKAQDAAGLDAAAREGGER